MDTTKIGDTVKTSNRWMKMDETTNDFPSIPPELLEPAFEPRKPETFTPEEWKALSPDECIACNELIRGEIELNMCGHATNLAFLVGDLKNRKLESTIFFHSIDTLQYCIKPKPKPKPEYEPYDKPEAWMVGKVMQSRISKNIAIISGIGETTVFIENTRYSMKDLFEDSDLYDPTTGETRPFGKLKGGE